MPLSIQRGAGRKSEKGHLKSILSPFVAQTVEAEIFVKNLTLHNAAGKNSFKEKRIICKK